MGQRSPGFVVLCVHGNDVCANASPKTYRKEDRILKHGSINAAASLTCMIALLLVYNLCNVNSMRGLMKASLISTRVLPGLWKVRSGYPPNIKTFLAGGFDHGK